MPFRVSGVPPLLLATIVSVSPSFPSSGASVRPMPSGSVLSMKLTAMRSARGSPRASATNMGPRADPPIPMERTRVNAGAPGGRIFPACTSAAKAFTAASPREISPARSSLGAIRGFLNQ